MSLRSIFSSVIARLRLRSTDSVNALAEELFAALTSDEPIVLSGRIVIHNPTNGPAITIVNTGDVNHEGVEVVDKDGRRVVLGIGHGSYGIYANNIQYRPEFKSDPDAVQELLSQLGGRGGQTSLTADSTEETPGSPRGPGVDSSTGFTSGGVGSGYTYPNAGSGVPGLVQDGSSDYVPVPGIGEMLGTVQSSGRDGHGGADATHPVDAALLLNLNGNPLWWPKDMHGWSINRVTVNTDYGDWLECTRFGIGDTVKVAKPYMLQKTPFHGETIDGITYSYTNNQCRVGTDSNQQATTEVVTPGYKVAANNVAGDVIYVRWVSNGTNVVGSSYIDVNADGRKWETSASGCTSGSQGSGSGSCPGGDCVYVWSNNNSSYNQTEDNSDSGHSCPDPGTLAYEGDDLTVCAMPDP